MKVKQPAPTFQPRDVTCSTCKAVLEVEFSDLRRKHWDGDQREPAYDEVSVICPECHALIRIDPVPAHLIPRIPTL
jgi:Zn finger protein HypA/HybF involved in hydrogenase expression